jgi:hypothetical protein
VQHFDTSHEVGVLTTKVFSLAKKHYIEVVKLRLELLAPTMLQPCLYSTRILVVADMRWCGTSQEP